METTFNVSQTKNANKIVEFVYLFARVAAAPG